MKNDDKKIEDILDQDVEEYRINLMKDEKKNMSNFSIIFLAIILLILGYLFWDGFWIINQQITISIVLFLMGAVTLYSGLFGKDISELSQEELRKSMSMRNKLLKYMLYFKKK